MRRKFTRKSGFRDSKLFIIACEGTVTEIEYFKIIKDSKIYNSSRIHLEILERCTTNSAPEYVLNELNDFNKLYSLSKYDELWAVIDFDNWGESKISKIAREINQKKYSLALSNPCFELWILLHYLKIDSSDQNILEKLKNKTELNKWLKEILQGYRKSLQSHNDSLINTIDNAVIQAKTLDFNRSDRWPKEPGTRVYLLIESLLNN